MLRKEASEHFRYPSAIVFIDTEEEFGKLTKMLDHWGFTWAGGRSPKQLAWEGLEETFNGKSQKVKYLSVYISDRYVSTCRKKGLMDLYQHEDDVTMYDGCPVYRTFESFIKAVVFYDKGPEDGDRYWYIAKDFKVDASIKVSGVNVSDLYIGNFFQTKGEAKRTADTMKDLLFPNMVGKCLSSEEVK